MVYSGGNSDFVITFIETRERESRVTFWTFDSANGYGTVAGSVERVERDVKNAASDREAAAMVMAGAGYKKEIDLYGPTGTRGRTWRR